MNILGQALFGGGSAAVLATIFEALDESMVLGFIFGILISNGLLLYLRSTK